MQKRCYFWALGNQLWKVVWMTRPAEPCGDMGINVDRIISPSHGGLNNCSWVTWRKAATSLTHIRFSRSRSLSTHTYMCSTEFISAHTDVLRHGEQKEGGQGCRKQETKNGDPVVHNINCRLEIKMSPRDLVRERRGWRLSLRGVSKWTKVSIPV